jgi:hypothetical protein
MQPSVKLFDILVDGGMKSGDKVGKHLADLMGWPSLPAGQGQNCEGKPWRKGVLHGRRTISRSSPGRHQWKQSGTKPKAASRF